MAPREEPKATPKVQRNVTKSTASTLKSTRSSPSTALKKTIEKNPLKKNNTTELKRQRTITAPVTATPKPKEKKPVPLPSSVTKSAKKRLWKRRPLPAHSGVPVPEKMKQLFKKQLENLNDSL